MKKATIYDYARMCKTYHTNCPACPMWNEVCTFYIMDNTQVDKANEIIIKWCEEHPIKTRQDKLLKMFPNAQKLNTGILSICPKIVDKTLDMNCSRLCSGCYKDYWLAEVDE